MWGHDHLPGVFGIVWPDFSFYLPFFLPIQYDLVSIGGYSGRGSSNQGLSPNLSLQTDALLVLLAFSSFGVGINHALVKQPLEQRFMCKSDLSDDLAILAILGVILVGSFMLSSLSSTNFIKLLNALQPIALFIGHLHLVK